jgi:hypothetical protein
MNKKFKGPAFTRKGRQFINMHTDIKLSVSILKGGNVGREEKGSSHH